MHKERRNKLRPILNPDLLIISFLNIKYTYVNILFIYLLIFFYLSLIYVSKGGFYLQIIWRPVRYFFFHYAKTFWYLTTFTVQRAILDIFWDKHFRVYFFVFWSASKKNYKFEINVKNVFLKCFHIFFCCVNYFFMIV
jgi:hypothetical protein